MANTQLLLKNVRLSFPKLAEPSVPRGFDDAKPRYSAAFIIPPDHESFAEIMLTVKKIAVETWKEHAIPMLQRIEGDRKTRFWADGSEKVNATTFEQYAGYKDMKCVSANSPATSPPKFGDPSGKMHNISTPEGLELARKLYGGCYVNAIVDVWPQSTPTVKAIRCTLRAVQFLADGEPLGGTDSPTLSFGEVAPKTIEVSEAAPAAAGFSWA